MAIAVIGLVVQVLILKQLLRYFSLLLVTVTALKAEHIGEATAAFIGRLAPLTIPTPLAALSVVTLSLYTTTIARMRALSAVSRLPTKSLSFSEE